MAIELDEAIRRIMFSYRTGEIEAETAFIRLDAVINNDVERIVTFK